MIGDILQPTHLIFILVVALLVLGPKRLPEVGRSLGRGIRDFRGALSGIDEAVNPPSSTQQAPPPPDVLAPPSPPSEVDQVPAADPALWSAEPAHAAVEPAPTVDAAPVSSEVATPAAASGAVEFDMKSAFPATVGARPTAPASRPTAPASRPTAPASRPTHTADGADGPDPDDYAD